MTKKLTCQKCEWAVLFPGGPRYFHDIFAQSLKQMQHIAQRHRELLQDIPALETATEKDVEVFFNKLFRIEDVQEA